MKKYLLLLAFGLIPMLLMSCSDDDSEGGFEVKSYLDGDYSPDNQEKLLSATIDGKEVAGNASVTFRAGDFKTGSLTLTNLFDGYGPITIESLTLTEVTENEYKRLIFSGSETVDDALSFNYSGYVVYGTLYLTLSTAD